MERGKQKMADVKNKGVIYVTSLDMVKKYYDLKFQPIRYTIDDPDKTIIYITRETNTITDSGVTRNIHGNRYFLLSKKSKITISQSGNFSQLNSQKKKFSQKNLKKQKIS